MAAPLQLLLGALATAAAGQEGRPLAAGGAAWGDRGAGCCAPADVRLVLWQGWLDNASLQDCQAKCTSFGDQCGFINHGWVQGGRKSTWCSVLSTKAQCSKLDSGPTDCGSCGDCGVHAYAYLGNPVQWAFEGRNLSCGPLVNIVKEGASVEECKLAAAAPDSGCGTYLHVHYIGSAADPDPKVDCFCTPPSDDRCYLEPSGFRNVVEIYKKRLAWSDIGYGCCVPMHQDDMLFQGPVSDKLEDCQAKCVTFGEQCGFVSHGWPGSSWCTVFSTKAQCTLDSSEKGCGSCGDCGVHTYSYLVFTPAPPVQWSFEGRVSCGPGIQSVRGASLEDCEREAAADSRCGDYLQVQYLSSLTSPDSKALCWCTVPGEGCLHAEPKPGHVTEVYRRTVGWSELGAGCCEPKDQNDFIFRGPLSDSLEDCEDKCASFGKQCGFVNHGWVQGITRQEAFRSNWCSLISSNAKCGSLDSGPTDCGSCGDCGVRAYAYLAAPPPRPPVQWLFEGRNFVCSSLGNNSIVPGGSLEDCQKEAAADTRCGDYLEVKSPFPGGSCYCTRPGEGCTPQHPPDDPTMSMVWEVYKKSI